MSLNLTDSLYLSPNPSSCSVFAFPLEFQLQNAQNSCVFLAFSSDKQIKIYRITDKYELFQTLYHDNIENAGPVQGHFSQDGTGWLAASFGTKILLYRCEFDSMEDMNWNASFLYFKNLKNAIESELLVAGDQISIFQLMYGRMQTIVQLKLLWNSSSLTLPIQSAEFSTDGSLFATTGKDDCNVKIWMKKVSQEVDYQFLYLHHPKPVTCFNWRKSTNATNQILLTNCQDAVTRIWTPSFQEFQAYPRFNAAAFITLRPEFEISKEFKFTCHWLHSSHLLSSSIHRYVSLNKHASDKLDYYQSKMDAIKKRLEEYPDLVLYVSKEGSITVWGIQHLSSKLIRTVKVHLIMKTEKSFSPIDARFMMGKVNIFYNPYTVEHAGNYFPSELYIIAQNPESSRLRAYSLSLDDLYAHSFRSLRAMLIQSWEGPIHPMQHLLPSPKGRFAIVFDGHSIEIYKLIAYQLFHVSFLAQKVHVHDRPVYTWLADDVHLIAGCGSCIALYQADLYNLKKIENLPGIPSDFQFFLFSSFTEGDDAFILALGYPFTSQNAVQCIVWKIEKSLDKTLHCVLWNIKSLAISEDIIECFDSCTFEKRQIANSNLKTFSFATLSISQRLQFWQYGWKGSFHVKDCDWICISDVQLPNSLALVSAGRLGYMATVCSSENLEFSIYEFNTRSMQMSNAWSNAVNDGLIVSIDWFFTANGIPLIALGMNQSISLLSPKLIKIPGKRQEWHQVYSYRLDDKDSLAFLRWIPDGRLFISTKHRNFIIERFYKQNSMEDEGKIERKTLFEQAYHMSGILPNHHPTLLLHYLIWNRHDLVRYELSLLARYLSLTEGKQIVHVPIPLWKALGIQEPINDKNGSQYDDLFSNEYHQDDRLESCIGNFNSNDANFIRGKLAIQGFLGLDPVEQKMLSALMDAFLLIEPHKQSFDENGIRAVVFMSIQKSLREHMKDTSQIDGLNQSRDMAWAAFSDSQDAILNSLSTMFDGKMTFADVKQFGLGFWIQNADSLKRQVEIWARNQYMQNDKRDPIDCSLFYLVLKKKSVLLGLWKLANAHQDQATMLKFLANDFEQERWRTVALKNAFALLGKQRYEYAAAFFLLADKLEDAVNVCLKNLNDIQLAVILCRVYQGNDSTIMTSIVQEHLIPFALNTQDDWLLPIAYSLLRDRDKVVQATSTSLDLQKGQTSSSDPALLVLYNHLKTHYQKLGLKLGTELSMVEEQQLIIRAIDSYEKIGCSMISLDLLGLVKLPVLDEISISESLLNEENPKDVNAIPSTTKDEEIDWGVPSTTVQQDDFWGEYKSPSNALDDEYEAFKNSLELQDDMEETNLMEELSETKSIKEPMEQPKEQTMLRPVVSVQDALKLAFEIKKLLTLKTVVVIRILAPAFHFLRYYMDQQELLSCDVILSKYPELIHQSINALETNYQLSPGFMEEMFMEFSRQMNLTSAYTFLYSLQDHKDWLTQFFIDEIVKNIRFIKGRGVLKRSLKHSIRALKDLKFLKGRGLDLGACNELMVLVPFLLFVFISLENGNFMLLRRCVVVLKDLQADTLNLHWDFFAKEIIEMAVDLNAMGDIDQDAYDEELDESGLPIRVYGTPESNKAERILQKRALDVIATWIERYLDVIKDNPTAELFSVAIMESMTRYLSFKLFECQQLILKENQVNVQMEHFNQYLDHPVKRDLWKQLNLRMSHEMTTMTEKPIGTESSVVSIFKDQSIVSFAIHPLNSLRIAFATPHQILEMNAKGIPIQKVMTNLSTDMLDIQKVDSNRSLDSSLTAPRIASSMDSTRIASSIDSGSAVGLPSTVERPKLIQQNSIELIRAEGLVGISHIESHPSLPYYLVAIHEWTHLYQFGLEQQVSSFQNKSMGRISKVHFDPFGIRYATGDSKGDLNLFNFEASQVSAPFRVIPQAHSGGVHDFTFLNSCNVLASTGNSFHAHHVHGWDALQPEANARIFTFTDIESYSHVTYSPAHQCLFVGGKKGKLFVFDLRARRLLDTMFAHEYSIKSLQVIDDHSLLTASRTGEIKLWDIEQFGKGLDAKIIGKTIAYHQSYIEKPSLPLSVVRHFDMMYKDGKVYSTHDHTLQILSI